jgi:hypothetical protein
MIGKAISLLLIVGSLSFAGLIIFQKNSDKVISSQNLIPKTENLPPKNLTTAEISDKNSTAEMAKQLVLELAKKNQNESAPLKPEQFVNGFLDEKLQNLDGEIFQATVKLSDLKIVKNSDKKFAEAYFKNLQTIIQNNIGSSYVEDFGQLATLYQKAIQQLYSLNVPESLAGIHQRELEILTVQKNVFEVLADYEKDPFKALVAAEVAKESYKDLYDLKAEMLNFIRKNNLNI